MEVDSSSVGLATGNLENEKQKSVWYWNCLKLTIKVAMVIRLLQWDCHNNNHIIHDITASLRDGSWQSLEWKV